MSAISEEIRRSEFEFALEELQIRNRMEWPKDPSPGDVVYLRLLQRLRVDVLSQPLDDGLTISSIGILFDGTSWGVPDARGEAIVINWWKEWNDGR